MKRALFGLVLASCSKTEPVADKPAPRVEIFNATHGAFVTPNDVRVDGKSLGILPGRLATDRDAFRRAVSESLAEHGANALALAYTDDAKAEAVLAALRGIDEVVAMPKPEEMALDEGKMGNGATALEEGKMTKHDERPIAITAMVGGKPVEICRAYTPASNPYSAHDERVMLALQIGHAQLTRGLTRMNAPTLALHPAELDRELHAQKASPVFADRDEIELAAAPDATGADLTPVVASSCNAGFRTVRPIPLAEMTAQLGQK
jgi:hypothetical protein